MEVVRRTLEEAMVVPQEALVRTETGYQVFVVEREGDADFARSRSVELGPAQRNEVVILSGIEPGARLVVVGQQIGRGRGPGESRGGGLGGAMIKQPENGRGKAPPKTEEELKEFKELRLTSFAIDHSTSVVLLFIIVALAGILTYIGIPKESFPELEIPMIAVSTIYPGVSPADMETLVTRPIEDELNTIGDIKELTSTSIEGYSSVVAEFETSVDLNEALQKVREKVDLARPELPEDAEEPMILEFDFEDVPIMQINLSGEYGLVRLKEIAEELQERIEQIPSILRVDLRGGLEREVKVDVDLAKLKFYGLALGDVIEAIQTENVNIPGGTIDVGAFKYLVRIDGEFEDPSVIEDLVVTTVDGRAVYVRDLATVEFGFAERETFARLDGAPVVTLDIVKRSGENIIETAEAVKVAIAETEAIFPPSTVLKITSDQTKEIRMMVSSLENNVISGLLLIIGVLFLFLGVRTSVFVALSIPTSMFLSFLVLGAMDVSMNMIVLFSLILALGMLVDNAIVIVENIYRYLEEGWDRVTASKKATGEVAMPVIAATFTTLAAFAPLLFWPGIIGDFMGYLPLTLIITLSSSLFVALVIISHPLFHVHPAGGRAAEAADPLGQANRDRRYWPLHPSRRRNELAHRPSLCPYRAPGLGKPQAVFGPVGRLVPGEGHPCLDPLLRKAALVGSGAPRGDAGWGRGGPGFHLGGLRSVQPRRGVLPREHPS